MHDRWELPLPLRRAGVRAMEAFRKSDALALLPSLLESQWWDADRLRERQLRDLRDHLEFCRDEVPFYRDLFSALGFHPAEVRSAGDLDRLPLMTKQTIHEAGDRLHARSFGARQPRAKRTSGSTGMPLNYFLDRPSHSYLWANIWRGWAQAGYRPGDLYATLSGGALTPNVVDFKQRVYQLASGAVQFPSYHLTEQIISGYIEVLRRRRIAYFYAYPSSTELFAEMLLEKKIRGLPVRAIFTTSEMLSPKARATIELGFGCNLFDTYGCNDGGLNSFECEAHDGFHYGMESVVVEAVDPDGRRLPDGEVGRLVTTHIANKSHPFVRYVTGDLGAVTEAPCACGRGLVRVVKLQGRDRDLVVTPDGRLIHGAFFNNFKPFYQAPWIERFQIHQPSLGVLRVRLMVSRAPTAAESGHITDELKRGLGNMNIEIDLVDHVELSAAGKFRVIISEVNK